jgi:hypothetical protein
MKPNQTWIDRLTGVATGLNFLLVHTNWLSFCCKILLVEIDILGVCDGTKHMKHLIESNLILLHASGQIEENQFLFIFWSDTNTIQYNKNI